MESNDLAKKYSSIEMDENCSIIQQIFREMHTLAHSSSSELWEDDESKEIYLSGLYSFHDKISFYRRQIENMKVSIEKQLKK